MQITLTFDLTEENLDKLKAFCTDTKATTKVTTKKTAKKTATIPVAVNTEHSEMGTQPAAEEKAEAEEQTTPKAEEQATTEADTSTTQISKTDVRAVALKISKAGKSDVLREIFSKFGATNLKGIAEDDYEALMRELVAVDV